MSETASVPLSLSGRWLSGAPCISKLPCYRAPQTTVAYAGPHQLVTSLCYSSQSWSPFPLLAPMALARFLSLLSPFYCSRSVQFRIFSLNLSWKFYNLQVLEACAAATDCGPGLYCGNCPASGKNQPVCTRGQAIAPTSIVSFLDFKFVHLWWIWAILSKIQEIVVGPFFLWMNLIMGLSSFLQFLDVVD